MKNRKEYMKIYMKNRYHKRKDIAKKLLGGKCVICGETKNLEFDHIDRTKKSFSISKGWSTSEKKFVKEVNKCQLLCQKHHIEKTIKDLGFKKAKGTHGTLSSYRYCKCDLCKKVHSEYMKNYKRKSRKKMPQYPVKTGGGL